MGKFRLERIKTCLIAILVLSGLVQIGILWNRQNHGLPFNFLALFFPEVAGYSNSNIIELEDVLSPYRVIISSGDFSYWQLNPDDQIYDMLFDDAKSNIKTVLSSKPQDTLSLDYWGNAPDDVMTSLIDRRSYMIQFATEIPNSVAGKLFDTKVSQNAPPGFSKILVTPGSDTDDTEENTVYVYSKSGGLIYKYVVKASNKGFNLDRYNSILERISQDGGIKYLEYTARHYFDEKGNIYDSEPDMLLVTQPPGSHDYRQIEVSIPDKLNNSEYTYNQLFDSEYGSFNITDSGDKAYITAKNLENQYKIYSNGILEYRYLLSHNDGNETSIGDSLQNALTFVNKGSKLIQNSKAKIFLKNIEKEDSYYKFTFDYRIEELPVYIDINPGGSGKNITNAIVIEADNKRVLSCRWQLLDIEIGHQTESFECRLDKIALSSGQSLKGFKIYDMSSGYFINSIIREKTNLWPSWVVEKAGGGYLDFDFKPKK